MPCFDTWDPLTFRPLGVDDLVAAAQLSVAAGWNQTVSDWRLMVTYGQAVGLFSPGGALAATALVLPFEPHVAWISMVLVDPAWRRQGWATRLLHHAVATIEAAGLRPVLDATEAGRRVYRSLGFQDLYPISRWEGWTSRQMRRPAPNPGVRNIKAGELAALAAWDQSRFVADRSGILRHLHRSAPAFACVAETPVGRPAGYVMGRPGLRATQIGPLVASHGRVATGLLERVLGLADGLVYLDVPDAQAGMIHLLEERGFIRQRGFVCMGKGPGALPGRPEQIFAIAGPELG